VSGWNCPTDALPHSTYFALLSSANETASAPTKVVRVAKNLLRHSLVGSFTVERVCHARVDPIPKHLDYITAK
jgi:hypothetical protein